MPKFPLSKPVVAGFGLLCLFLILAGPALDMPSIVRAGLVLLTLVAILVLGEAERPATPAPAIPRQTSSGLPTGFGQALLQRLPAPLIVIGGDERLAYANPAALALLPGARVGQHYSGLVRAPAFIEAVDAVLASGEDREFTFTQLSGQARHFMGQVSALPPGSFGARQDQPHVLVLIEDRTRDRALLQSRSDFVANASHELRTPLASILGYIETLQGHARDDPEAQERFLGIMAQQAGRMQRLVDDLMSLNRIELNAHVPPEDPVDLFEIAAEAAATLFPIASEGDVLLQVELPKVQAPILGDRDQIAQVVVNLVDNAIKYGGSGKKVRVLPAEPSPRFPGHVGVSVIDQGQGIARQNIPRLTERFFRVSDAKSREVGGTGLGLAISKHILTRHDGALDIQSTLGEGSRFTVWIPQRQVAAIQA